MELKEQPKVIEENELSKSNEERTEECLICSENFSQKDVNEEYQNSYASKSSKECRTVENQLQVIFLLRKLLKIPEDVCCNFLQYYGNPNSWIHCCNSCSGLVAEARFVSTKIKILEKRYKKLRKTVKTKIVDSGNSEKFSDSHSQGGAKETVRSYLIRKHHDPTALNSQIKVKTENVSDSEITDDESSCIGESYTQNYSTEFDEDFSNLGSERSNNGRSDFKMCNVKKEETEESQSPNTVLSNDQISSNVDKVRYSCIICERTYSTIYKLKYHKQKHKEGKEFLRKSAKRKNLKVKKWRKRPHVCSICGKKFPLLANLKCHERVHTGGNPNECEFCGKIFSRSGALSFHLQTHTGEKPFICKICNKDFAQSSDLKTHLNMHTGEKPYECEICKKTFSSSSNKSKHKRGHAVTKEKQYFPCEVCTKVFTKEITLTNHMKIHTGETPYVCEVCGKSFSQSSTLKGHLKSHTGERPFTCEFCGKGFICNSNLKVHTKIHTGEKPYSCEMCGKGFVQQNNLKIHTLTHSNDKPYTCDICGKSFRKASYFKEHVNSHKEENSFKCNSCGKSFTHSYHLKRHLRTHTGEKPYPCAICEKAFTQSSDLRRHEKTHTIKI